MPDGSSIPRSARHETARLYAADLIPVFPCRVGGKEPATPNGFKDATTSIEQIDRWWVEADYNVAICPESAGWCVVDLDPKDNGPANWRALCDANGGEPATYTVATPSGGKHLYFMGSLPSSVRKLGHGIDTRGRGGYVLIAPSRVNGKTYHLAENGCDEPAPLPAWVSAALGHSERKRAEAPANVEWDQPETIAWVRQQIAADLDKHGPPIDGEASDIRTYAFINRLFDGDRYGCSVNPETVVDLLVEHWAPHFDREWIEAKADSAVRSRQNDFGCAQAGSDERTFGKAVAEYRKNQEDTPAERATPTLVHIRDRATALNAPDPVMLVAEIVPDKKLIMPWGDTGCGKTYWSLEVATAIAMRRPAFGRFPVMKPGTSGIAVIFAGEDCDYLDKCRLTAIERHFGQSLQGLVYTVDTAIPVSERAKVQFDAYCADLRRLQDITGKPVDIISNDTLKRSLGSLKQNDDDAARRFTEVMEGLIAEFGCAIICNAHEPKSGPDAGIAGSGDFTANCPVTPHLVGEKDESKRLVAIECRFEPKFRVGPTPKPFTVKTVAVPLPKPVAGITSDLVLIALTDAEQASRSPAQQTKIEAEGWCRAIERALCEAEARHLDNGLTTEVLILRLVGSRYEGESENDYARRKHDWKLRLDNGARRPEGRPAFGRYFQMDCRNQGDDTLRIPRPVRRWFMARPTTEPEAERARPEATEY